MQVVSDERLQELFDADTPKDLRGSSLSRKGGERWCCFMAGARAYEKELGITQIIEVPPSRAFVMDDHAAVVEGKVIPVELREGAVLVRACPEQSRGAKEKE